MYTLFIKNMKERAYIHIRFMAKYGEVRSFAFLLITFYFQAHRYNVRRKNYCFTDLTSHD